VVKRGWSGKVGGAGGQVGGNCGSVGCEIFFHRGRGFIFPPLSLPFCWLYFVLLFSTRQSGIGEVYPLLQALKDYKIRK